MKISAWHLPLPDSCFAQRLPWNNVCLYATVTCAQCCLVSRLPLFDGCLRATFAFGQQLPLRDSYLRTMAALCHACLRSMIACIQWLSVHDGRLCNMQSKYGQLLRRIAIGSSLHASSEPFSPMRSSCHPSAKDRHHYGCHDLQKKGSAFFGHEKRA